jgi:hypothetical protein
MSGVPFQIVARDHGWSEAHKAVVYNDATNNIYAMRDGATVPTLQLGFDGAPGQFHAEDTTCSLNQWGTNDNRQNCFGYLPTPLTGRVDVCNKTAGPINVKVFPSGRSVPLQKDTKFEASCSTERANCVGMKFSPC